MVTLVSKTRDINGLWAEGARAQHQLELGRCGAMAMTRRPGRGWAACLRHVAVVSGCTHGGRLQQTCHPPKAHTSMICMRCAGGVLGLRFLSSFQIELDPAAGSIAFHPVGHVERGVLDVSGMRCAGGAGGRAGMPARRWREHAEMGAMPKRAVNGQHGERCA